MRAALWLLAAGVALGGRVDPEAVGKTRDKDLRAVLDEHWSWVKSERGEGLTRFENRSPDTRARQRREAEQLLGWLRQADPTLLSPADFETWTLLERSLQGRVDEPLCHLDRWLVTRWRNPFMAATVAARARELSGPGAIRLVARVERLPTEVEHEIRSLRLGLAGGRVVDRETLSGLIAYLEALRATPLEDWDLTAPARLPHPGWRVHVVGAFATELMAAARAHAVPALESYLAFLRDELLPEAGDRAPGLVGLPGGEACYAERIRWHTTLDVTAEELHAQGHAAVAALEAEVAGLGFTLERLRGDPALRYASAEAIEDAAHDAVREAWGALRQGFARRPRVAVAVEAMPTAWSEASWAAYYRRPPQDGSGPGTYVVNTTRPGTRPAFEARALAFHEAVPGHHLQATLGVLDRDLPAFRRGGGPTVLVEGWALYAEGLAGELGLYPTTLDEAGRVTMALQRAARLVVDTGLHARGWSRERAVAYLQAHTVLGPEEAAVEVERYLAWPGQALAYHVGAEAIRGLRAEVEALDGVAFDLKGFHGVVLEGGAVTIPLLEARVRAWMWEGRD